MKSYPLLNRKKIASFVSECIPFLCWPTTIGYEACTGHFSGEYWFSLFQNEAIAKSFLVRVGLIKCANKVSKNKRNTNTKRMCPLINRPHFKKSFTSIRIWAHNLDVITFLKKRTWRWVVREVVVNLGEDREDSKYANSTLYEILKE